LIRINIGSSFYGSMETMRISSLEDHRETARQRLTRINVVDLVLWEDGSQGG
jgi:hypothetical protein